MQIQIIRFCSRCGCRCRGPLRKIAGGTKRGYCACLIRGRMFATLLAEEAAVGDIGEKRVEVDQVYAFVADMLSHNVDIVTVVEFLD